VSAEPGAESVPVPLSRSRGIAELFLAAVLFGFAAFVAKRATATADGAQVAFLRFAFGLAFALLLSAARRSPLRPSRWDLLLLRGVFGGTAVLLYFLSLNELPVGTATLLNCTSPAFTAVFAVIFLREKLPWGRAAALLLAGGGIALVVYGQGRALGGAYEWQVVALLSGVCAGAAVTSIRAARRTDGPWEIFAVFCAVGLLCTAPLALARWQSPSAWGWFLLTAVGLLSLGGQILLTHALGAVEAASAVTISQMTVITSMSLGYFVDGDPLTVVSLAGSGLTLLGVVWVAWTGARSERANGAPPVD
jgi:drug/metabolite transporter (DMT)-like permease